jgi:hypothetical protein
VDNDPCSLDQSLTSAGAAMAFAGANWDFFEAWFERTFGKQVPITRTQMHHHGAHVLALTDPDRMPER